jgi:hypothetical protein
LDYTSTIIIETTMSSGTCSPSLSSHRRGETPPPRHGEVPIASVREGDGERRARVSRNTTLQYFIKELPGMLSTFMTGGPH